MNHIKELLTGLWVGFGNFRIPCVFVCARDLPRPPFGYGHSFVFSYRAWDSLEVCLLRCGG